MFVNGNQEYEIETIFAIKSLQQKISYQSSELVLVLVLVS